MLKVTEHFAGLQGEGTNIGVPTYFVRLSGCNLNCVWCDTQYAKMKGKMMTEEELWEEVKVRMDLPWLCITGGEPLLQNIERFVDIVKDNSKMQISVETNGTQIPAYKVLALVDQWTISPKLTNSGCLKQLNLDALLFFMTHRNIQFKFVCEASSDVMEAIGLMDKINEHIRVTEPIIFQPQGRKFQNKFEYLGFLKELWEFVCGVRQLYPYNMRVLPQLHVLLYGQRRGV